MTDTQWDLVIIPVYCEIRQSANNVSCVFERNFFYYFAVKANFHSWMNLWDTLLLIDMNNVKSIHWDCIYNYGQQWKAAKYKAFYQSISIISITSDAYYNMFLELIPLTVILIWQLYIIWHLKSYIYFILKKIALHRFIPRSCSGECKLHI